jgi:UDP-N-acetylmuramate dehydrogenase
MLAAIRGEVRFKEPLSFHTSVRIGGTADFFITPLDVDDVRRALSYANRERVSVIVLGGGNNLLVTDRGIRGAVLKLSGKLSHAEFHGEEVLVGAGMSLSSLLHKAA